MGLPRLILMAIIVGAGFWLWRRFTSRSERPAPASPVQSMVCCAHCHVHLLQDRARQDSDKNWYCCPEHLKLGPKPRD